MIARLLFAAALSITTALAVPPLTTIQDTLYKADGTPFNGTLSISWTNFEAIDKSAITMQAITTTVVNGILRKRDKITWSLWTWRDTVVPLAVKFRLLDHEFR